MTFCCSSGEPGFVMIKRIDLSQEFDTLDKMVERLKETGEHHNIEKIKSWHYGFRWFLLFSFCCKFLCLKTDVFCSGIMLISSRRAKSHLKPSSATRLTLGKSSPSFSSARKERVSRWLRPQTQTGVFQPNFEFASPGLRCGEPAPDVLLQAIMFQHNRYYRSSGQCRPK